MFKREGETGEQESLEDLNMDDLKIKIKELNNESLRLSDIIGKVKESLQYPQSSISPEELQEKSRNLDEIYKRQDEVDSEKIKYIEEIERRKGLGEK